MLLWKEEGVAVRLQINLCSDRAKGNAKIFIHVCRLFFFVFDPAFAWRELALSPVSDSSMNCHSVIFHYIFHPFEEILLHPVLCLCK